MGLWSWMDQIGLVCEAVRGLLYACLLRVAIEMLNGSEKGRVGSTTGLALWLSGWLTR